LKQKNREYFYGGKGTDRAEIEIIETGNLKDIWIVLLYVLGKLTNELIVV